jgi:uncharacterized protein (DUF1810 family)
VDAAGLDRFLVAQEPVIEQVLRELRAGRKRSHWMWFVFPQISGLGASETSRYYAIQSLDEAKMYLAHPVLGERLRRCAQILLESEAQSAEAVLGVVDARKLRSSVTLFLRADPRDALLRGILERWFDGQPDQATDRLLALTRRASDVPAR